MPISVRNKCRQCSKLPLHEALQKHRREGEPCHKRRTYYHHRDRYNRSRRLKYKGEQESAVQLEEISIRLFPL